jgi:hypothetical protein
MQLYRWSSRCSSKNYRACGGRYKLPAETPDHVIELIPIRKPVPTLTLSVPNPPLILVDYLYRQISQKSY